MRSLALSATMLASLAGAPAFAQTQRAAQPARRAAWRQPGNRRAPRQRHRHRHVDADGHARQQHRPVRHALADRAEPAEPARWARMPARRITCARRRRRCRPAAPARHSSRWRWRRPACSIARCRMGQTNNPERQSGGVADLAGAEGTGRRRSGADHAVDPVDYSDGDRVGSDDRLIALPLPSRVTRLCLPRTVRRWPSGRRRHLRSDHQLSASPLRRGRPCGASCASAAGAAR